MQITELLELTVATEEEEQRWLLCIENESATSMEHGIIHDVTPLDNLSNEPLTDIPSVVRSIRTSEYWCRVGSLVAGLNDIGVDARVLKLMDVSVS